jgi:hypothetical protein
MQAAQRARVQTALRLFSLGVPVNVINRNLDLGLPDLPHGENCYLPATLQNAGELQAQIPKALPRNPMDRMVMLTRTGLAQDGPGKG